MAPLVQLLTVVLVGAVIVALAIRFVQVVTVHDYERGLRFSQGRLRGVVPSGTHVALRPFSEIRLVDGRPTTLLVEGQEVMTADGIPVKISLAARYVVSDVVAATLGDADFRRATYIALQLMLRNALSGLTLDEAIAARREIGPSVRESAAGDLAAIGVELLAVEVRDVMVPGELKRAYAGVIAARKEGEAALERARSETAALRNLANAGRMLEDNPTLLHLRMLQEVGGSTGNTIMLGLPDGARPAAAARATAAPAIEDRAATRGRGGRRAGDVPAPPIAGGRRASDRTAGTAAAPPPGTTPRPRPPEGRG